MVSLPNHSGRASQCVLRQAKEKIKRTVIASDSVAIARRQARSAQFAIASYLAITNVKLIAEKVKIIPNRFLIILQRILHLGYS